MDIPVQFKCLKTNATETLKNNMYTESEIKRAALLNYTHPDFSYDKLLELSKRFSNLSSNDLEKEKNIIEKELCKYNTESVAKYRIAMTLFNFIEKNKSYES